MHSNIKIVDVLIIGGGPAGLTCASTLGRLGRTAIVFSHGKFRDDVVTHMHGVLGWEDRRPSELREAARNEIRQQYSDMIQFKDVEVQRVRRLQNGRFDAICIDTTCYQGRRVLLASGIRDLMPIIPGYESMWGRGM